MNTLFLSLASLGFLAAIIIYQGQVKPEELGLFINYEASVVVIASWLFSLAQYSFGDIIKAHYTAIKKVTISPNQSKHYSGILNRLREFYTATGLLCVLYGSATALMHLDKPKHIGAAIALCLLGIFYAFIFAELLTRPLAHIHRKNLLTKDHDEDSDRSDLDKPAETYQAPEEVEGFSVANG